VFENQTDSLLRERTQLSHTRPLTTVKMQSLVNCWDAAMSCRGWTQAALSCGWDAALNCRQDAILTCWEDTTLIYLETRLWFVKRRGPATRLWFVERRGHELFRDTGLRSSIWWRRRNLRVVEGRELKTRPWVVKDVALISLRERSL